MSESHAEPQLFPRLPRWHGASVNLFKVQISQLENGRPASQRGWQHSRRSRESSQDIVSAQLGALLTEVPGRDAQ